MFHDKKERCLPKADACFNRLILSTVSVMYEEFKKNFIICLSSGGQGFGRFLANIQCVSKSRGLRVIFKSKKVESKKSRVDKCFRNNPNPIYYSQSNYLPFK